MLRNEIKNNPMFGWLDQTARALGLRLVDVQRNFRGPSDVQMVLTVFNPSGETGTEDCERFHRAVQPRLELEVGRDLLSMEVGTPGLQRNLRDVYEFSVFMGKQARVYSTTRASWMTGTISNCTENSVTLSGFEVENGGESGEEIVLEFSDIQKARLEYKWPGANEKKRVNKKNKEESGTTSAE